MSTSNPLDAVRALIFANGLLEQELADVYAKASAGFLRSERRKTVTRIEKPIRRAPDVEN